MSDLYPDAQPSIEEQIKCVLREIGMRERVYPRWIEQRKLLPKKAEREIALMRAVLETLRQVERTTLA